MSVKASTWVWDNSPYTGAAKLIHLKMADVANDMQGNRVWLGDRNLAEKAGCDERTVRRVKAQMIADGLLEDLGKNPESGFKEYRLVLPQAGDQPDISSCAEPPDILSGPVIHRTSHPGNRTSHPDRPDISNISPITNSIELKELSETGFPQVSPEVVESEIAEIRSALTERKAQ